MVFDGHVVNTPVEFATDPTEDLLDFAAITVDSTADAPIGLVPNPPAHSVFPRNPAGDGPEADSLDLSPKDDLLADGVHRGSALQRRQDLIGDLGVVIDLLDVIVILDDLHEIHDLPGR